MHIQYCSIGDVDKIGASSHYVQLEDVGIILDAGLDPHNPSSAGIPQYELLTDHPVHAIVISHAHLDHIGSLPVALRYFHRARVYMTPSTADLTELMLQHALQVQQKQARENWKAFQPLYTLEFLEMIRYLYQTFPYETPFPLHGYEHRGIRFTFYDAGHILGSAGVLIEFQGKRIFYTGNVRTSAQFILKGARFPKEVDILISEATYGADAEAEQVKRSQEIKRFAARLSEHIRMGGIVLLPVFALGRTQEMLMLIHQLRQRGKIPGVPIFVAGMGLRINRLYDRMLHKIYPQYDRGMLRTITFGRWSRGRRLQGPAILISTSGMLIPNSPSFKFASQLAKDARNAIFMVGYADPETPGGLLREHKKEELARLFNVQSLECGVELFRFSAHSHRGELLNMVQRMQPKHLILTHGEPAALAWMAKTLQQRAPQIQVTIPQKGQWIPLNPS